MLADVQVVDKRLEMPAMAHVIHDYWLEKRGRRTMPSRADIDPADIRPALLPFIQLVDVVDDERKYVYRLNGTQDVRVRGHDPKGKSVRDAFWGPDAEDAMGCYDRVIAERAPIIDPVPYDDGEHISEFSLFLPLSDDDGKINMIMVFSINRDSKPRLTRAGE